MAYEITNADNGLIMFLSERVGGLERIIRQLSEVRDDIQMLNDELDDELIDPDGLADRLLENAIDAKAKALDAYLSAKAGEEEESDNMEYHCAEHGDVQITKEVTTPGFTGAPIYVADLSCGCQLVDDSADNAEAAR